MFDQPKHSESRRPTLNKTKNKGSRTSCSNCRQTSILPIFSKLSVKGINFQLQSFMSDNGVISPNIFSNVLVWQFPVWSCINKLNECAWIQWVELASVCLSSERTTVELLTSNHIPCSIRKSRIAFFHHPAITNQSRLVNTIQLWIKKLENPPPLSVS
mgnify:CR=1 FL=1